MALACIFDSQWKYFQLNFNYAIMYTVFVYVPLLKAIYYFKNIVFLSRTWNTPHKYCMLIAQIFYKLPTYQTATHSYRAIRYSTSNIIKYAPMHERSCFTLQLSQMTHLLYLVTPPQNTQSIASRRYQFQSMRRC